MRICRIVHVFTWDELGDEKLVQKALTQPFYASYRTYKRYGNPTDENRLRHIQIRKRCAAPTFLTAV